jgi:hypothetical protein
MRAKRAGRSATGEKDSTAGAHASAAAQTAEDARTRKPFKKVRYQMPGVENRKHSRIPVSVPVYYTSFDDQGTILNFNMGVVRDISQSGVALEAYSEPDSESISLSFVDVSGTTLEIRGKSIYSKKAESGVIKIGVMLLGDASTKIAFVRELVRFHHYTKKSIANSPP